MLRHAAFGSLADRIILGLVGIVMLVALAVALFV
jgi:hypothetical protein